MAHFTKRDVLTQTSRFIKWLEYPALKHVPSVFLEAVYIKPHPRLGSEISLLPAPGNPASVHKCPKLTHCLILPLSASLFGPLTLSSSGGRFQQTSGNSPKRCCLHTIFKNKSTSICLSNLSRKNKPRVKKINRCPSKMRNFKEEGQKFSLVS